MTLTSESRLQVSKCFLQTLQMACEPLCQRLLLTFIPYLQIYSLIKHSPWSLSLPALWMTPTPPSTPCCSEVCLPPPL